MHKQTQQSHTHNAQHTTHNTLSGIGTLHGPDLCTHLRTLRAVLAQHVALGSPRPMLPVYAHATKCPVLAKSTRLRARTGHELGDARYKTAA
eukprot:1862975-Rhodomonas_salina.1